MLRNRLVVLRLKGLDILNEVLSLNAQESAPASHESDTSNVLNEVLSLNAQEFDGLARKRGVAASSMKS